MMYFEEYQAMAWDYAIYPDIGDNPGYPALGLAGEAGEVCNKIKKIYRDGLNKDTIRNDIASELSDVLWYLAAVASEFDLNLDDIATDNLAKLEDRRKRGVIGGSGDNR